MTSSVNLRDTYKTPSTGVIAADKNDMITAITDQGLSLQSSDRDGDNYSGILCGVAFDFAIASNGGFSYVTGSLLVQDCEIKTFDHVRCDRIPDLRTIAEIARNTADNIKKFPTVAYVFSLLPGLESPMRWQVSRHVTVSSSGKLSVDWTITIAHSKLGVLISNNRTSSAKKAPKVLEGFDLNSIETSAIEKVKRQALYDQYDKDVIETTEAFKVIKDHPNVYGVSVHGATAQIVLNGLTADKIAVIMAALDSLG